MFATDSDLRFLSTGLTSCSRHALPSEERATLSEGASNTVAFEHNTLLPDATEAVKENTAHDPASIAPVKEPNPEGIQPVANYIPSEPTFSHPTPPPEPPVTSISAIVEPTTSDTPPAEATVESDLSAARPAESEILQADTVSTSVQEPAPVVAQSLTTAEIAPVNETAPNPVSDIESANARPNGMSAPDAPPDTSITAETTVKLEPSSSTLVRQRDDDTEDVEPAAKRSRLEDEDTNINDAPEAAPASAAPVIDAEGDVSMADTSFADTTDIKPDTASDSKATYYTNPMTDVQKSYLMEKTKNLKKTKHASAFLFPVDPVKLNIPNYPNIVKNPMDLATLENKLKADEHASPQAYADDFNQIVTNTKLFNGESHAVTVAAINMEAYFKKYMSTLPNPDQTALTKAIKKQEPAIARPARPREARVPQPPPAPVQQASARKAASPPSNQTFALQADGTPQIRRDSTTKRPHRTIKQPNRELSYAKPKRKEHQLELKFCEHVLDELRGHQYSNINHVFLFPVDPVALNIPHYRQIVKKPMDMSTMAQKLKTGQYSTAKEFKADFDLMIDNCLSFNPPGNPVHNIGNDMRRSFEAIWKDKEKWERANKKSSERASSESADESEEDSDDDDEDDDGQAATRETIAMLTKQLAELQKTVANTKWGTDKKKTKDGKKSKKSSLSAPSKPKSGSSKQKVAKRIKPLTYEEKQEISNAVVRMNEVQVNKLTQIITENCEKYRNMGDDMELEIDDLPNDIQAMLLKYVRSIFGGPARGARNLSPEDVAAEDDDDFAPPVRDRPAGSGKRKKHKPMGKKEQQDSINELRSRLAAFKNPASESESPRSAQAYGQPAEETSGDEDSEESEEE